MCFLCSVSVIFFVYNELVLMFVVGVMGKVLSFVDVNFSSFRCLNLDLMLLVLCCVVLYLFMLLFRFSFCWCSRNIPDIVGGYC